MSPIVLYIFSGPHLGAKISLKHNKTVLGSDDSADIILYAQKESKDFAIEKRHASIEIPEDFAVNNKVLLHELDGKVFLENVENEENPLESGEVLEISAGQVFYLASTCMVWNYPHVEQEMVSPALYGNKFLGAENKIDDNNDNLVDNSLQLENTEEAIEEKEKTLVAKVLANAKYPLIYTALIVLLLSLSLYYAPSSNSFAAEYEYLVEELAKNGFTSIEVEESNINSQESILIKGYVKSEEERLKIQQLARTLQYPVYLDLEVQGDLVRAVEDSFSLYALFLEPEMLEDTMLISGYVFNKAIEDAAFADLANNVNNLPVIKRNIVNADTLQPLLENSLTTLQVQFDNIAYDAGQVRIIGIFDESDMLIIHEVMNDIIATLQTPIMYTIHSSEPNITASKVIESQNAENVQSLLIEDNLFNQAKSQNANEMSDILNFMSDFTINSVHFGEIPFVTSSDNKKYFEGSALENGFTIESINKDSIELRKGTQVKRIYFSANEF